MPKIAAVIKPKLKNQILRRAFKQQNGTYRTTYLAKVNGKITAPKPGYLWVHDLAGADANGNNTYNAPYQMRLKPGAAIQYRSNWKVHVIKINGIDYIESMDFDELERIGYNPLQTNVVDPSRLFIPTDYIENLRSFPNGDENVRVYGSVYRKADGTYAYFPNTYVDILTGNVPSADNQVVVCLWLKDDNTIEVTVSSEESQDANLKQDIATTITLINECAAAATAGAMGIDAYLILDTTTAIGAANRLHDLRGIVGMGSSTGATGAISADTLVLNDGSELTLSANTDGAITVSHARHTVDTFDDEATGDLKTVNGLAANEVCVITANHTDRTVVVKHTGGTDISCATGADITLDDTVKAVCLIGNVAGTGVNAYPLQSSGGTGAPVDATYIVQTSNGTLTNEQVLASLATGLVKNTTTTGVLSIAAEGTDYSLLPVADTTAIVKGSADATKQFRIEVDGFGAGVTRVMTPPNADFTPATNTLNNLGTTAINAILFPDGSGTRNIGGTIAYWNSFYATTIILKEQGTLGSMDSGYGGYYANSDGHPHYINDLNEDYDLLGQRYFDNILLINPTLQSWTTLNTGVGTFTEDTTEKCLTAVSDGNGTAQLRGFYCTAPTPGYEVRLLFRYWSFQATGNNGVCVGWRQNSTGELVVLSYTNQTTSELSWILEKWNSATSLNSAYIASAGVDMQTVWIKLHDDGATNRVISISADGQAWSVVHTIGRTDFLTPDEIFFGVRVASNESYNLEASLLSYEEI